MKSIFPALILAVSATSAAQPPSTAPSPAQVDALMALAMTHGVVRYFHPSDSLDLVNWDRFLVHAAGRLGTVGSAAEIAPRLAEVFTPVVEGFKVAPAGTAAAAPVGEGARVEWRHLGYGLETDANSPYASWRTHHDPVGGGKVKGGFFQHRAAAEQVTNPEPVTRIAIAPGLEAHVPVSLPLPAAKVGAAQKARLDMLARTLEGVTLAGESVTRAQAHADGIAAWNVARHFYPYWGEVKVDWEAQLRNWLAEQPATQTRAQLRDGLRRLTAPLDDGHVGVSDPKDSTARGFLPISVRPLDDRWVVDASQAAQVRAGDVIVALDGKPVSQWAAERLALASGSPHHKRWRVSFELVSGAKDTTVALRLRRGTQQVDATLAYGSQRRLQGPRPAAIAEVRPGIHYVDVSRFDKAAFEKAIATLKEAKAIVFDLRGYPAGDAFALVPHWLPGEDKAQWMFVPRYDKPFAHSTTAWSIGWQAQRNPALEKPAKVLLTDARAISYSESLAAYFPDLKVGPVVGEPTAGANGNVARATLPSGMGFFFTSMRVTRHDGRTPLHGAGIAPDVAVTPTLEGISAGRDEVLERGIAIAQQRGG